MVFSDAQLAAWLTAWWLPFVRIAAALSVAPLFGSRSIPPQVRLMMSLVLALLLMPWQTPVEGFEPLGMQGVLLTANEIVLGLLLGFLLQLVFEAVLFAGQFIATSMGLAFATMIDSQQGISVAVLGQFFSIMTMLLFLAMNGHLVYIQLVGESFRVWPAGSAWVSPESLQLATGALGTMLRHAVGIAIPAAMALMVVQLAMGVISRSSPTLNLFAVGFPVTLLVGLIVLERTLPALRPQVEMLLDNAFATMNTLLETGHGSR